MHGMVIDFGVKVNCVSAVYADRWVFEIAFCYTLYTTESLNKM